MTRAFAPRPNARVRPEVSRRYDTLSGVDWLAQAQGYVMVRRPSSHPFTMRVEDWERLPRTHEEAKAADVMIRWGVIEPGHSRRKTDPKPRVENEISFVDLGQPWEPPARRGPAGIDEPV